MQCNKQKPFLFIILISVTTICFVFSHPQVVVTNYSDKVVKTVGHIDVPQTFRLLTYDNYSDTAYYTIDKDIMNLSIGDEVVLINNKTFVVTDITTTGFTVKVNNVEDVYRGMSGTPVVHNDEVVGYVSTLIGNSSLFCIWR